MGGAVVHVAEPLLLRLPARQLRSNLPIPGVRPLLLPVQDRSRLLLRRARSGTPVHLATDRHRRVCRRIVTAARRLRARFAGDARLPLMVAAAVTGVVQLLFVSTASFSATQRYRLEVDIPLGPGRRPGHQPGSRRAAWTRPPSPHRRRRRGQCPRAHPRAVRRVPRLLPPHRTRWQLARPTSPRHQQTHQRLRAQERPAVHFELSPLFRALLEVSLLSVCTLQTVTPTSTPIATAAFGSEVTALKKQPPSGGVDLRRVGDQGHAHGT